MLQNRHTGKGQIALVLVSPALLAWGGTAHAQDRDEDPVANPDQIVLGAGVAATPTYQGSNDYRILPLPTIDIKQGWFFANLRNGIGVAPLDNETVTVGASAQFMQGYRRKDVPAGIDRLKDGVGVRLFTTLRTSNVVTTLGVIKGVSGGTRGVIADASISYPVSISSRFTLTPTIGTTWANARYNDSYFGVTAAEARASGLRQFSPGAGFKDVSGLLTASYRLTDRITVSATGGVTTLIGPVKDSPLVQKKTQPSGILTFTYRL